MKIIHFVRFLNKELFYAGLGKEEFLQVKESIDEKNRKSLISWSIVCGLFWFVSLFLYSAPEYARCRPVFFVAFFICVFTLICALFIIKRFPRVLFPTMYTLQLSALGTGIGLAVVQPDLRIATVIAVATIVPTFFIDITIASIIIETTAIVAYFIFGKLYINADIFSWGIETLIIFSIAGTVSGHIINKARFERYFYEESAKKLAAIQKNYSEELEKDVRAKTEKIVALQDQMIMGMATMIEGRDNSTGGHIRRTSAAVRILLEAIREDGSMQLPESFCEKLIKAAPMHDLGKIAVDDDILRKPGRYTPEDYEAMKTHAAEGARIIREILANTDDEEFRCIAENIAHYHHERFDGSGYPDKLKGKHIPLEARIMAIADVYDALVSERAYKERYSFEQADRIILNGMGKQFDPALRKYYHAARPKLEAYYAEDLLES